jgi:hypothetical protein
LLGVEGWFALEHHNDEIKIKINGVLDPILCPIGARHLPPFRRTFIPLSDLIVLLGTEFSQVR